MKLSPAVKVLLGVIKGVFSILSVFFNFIAAFSALSLVFGSSENEDAVEDKEDDYGF